VSKFKEKFVRVLLSDARNYGRLLDNLITDIAIVTVLGIDAGTEEVQVVSSNYIADYGGSVIYIGYLIAEAAVPDAGIHIKAIGSVKNEIDRAHTLTEARNTVKFLCTKEDIAEAEKIVAEEKSASNAWPLRGLLVFKVLPLTSFRLSQHLHLVLCEDFAISRYPIAPKKSISPAASILLRIDCFSSSKQRRKYFEFSPQPK
jgi:hypothetical protein